MNPVNCALLLLLAGAQFGPFAMNVYANAATISTGGQANNERAAAPDASKNYAPLSILVDGPEGQRLRLDYAVNSGGRISRTSQSNAPDVSALSAAMDSESADIDFAPLAVYVDGPSGFVYIWSRDGGWRFVGHVGH